MSLAGKRRRKIKRRTKRRRSIALPKAPALLASNPPRPNSQKKTITISRSSLRVSNLMRKMKRHTNTSNRSTSLSRITTSRISKKRRKKTKITTTKMTPMKTQRKSPKWRARRKMAERTTKTRCSLM